MTINSDSIFLSAKQKFVCEDYALCGHDPVPFMILSDGCSSSENTDVGSRLLTHCVKKTLNTFVANSSLDIETLGNVSISFAKSATDILNLPDTCLDATLIVAYINNKYLEINMYGDGTYVCEYKDGRKKLVTVSYKDNMPYYLNYIISLDRKKLYEEHTKDSSLSFKRIDTISYEQCETKYEEYNSITHDSIEIDSIKSISIFSDGISSFVDCIKNEKIQLQKIIELFTSYKTTAGEFVKRRVRKAVEDLYKNHIYNTDDISCCCMIFVED